MSLARLKLFSGSRKLFILLFFLGSSCVLQAQFLTQMIDTSTNVGKGILQMYRKFDRIYFTGYLQPQFQVAQRKGVDSWNGGDFAPKSNSRFMLRRGRVRLDYVRMSNDEDISLYFVFQFDGTERGVVIRDFWGRIFENKWRVFNLTTGMFARPFGYEVNLSSGDRESPERGRMSQILMRNERDLGAMISFEPRRKDHPLRNLKIDAGVFNGQGLTAPSEYDSYKDFIARAAWRPYPLTKDFYISGGLSYLNGGLFQNTKYTYEIASDLNGKHFLVDSADDNLGRKAPRQYYGADMQLKWKRNNGGATELRLEYWRGTQTASAGTSETPTALLDEPYYVRKFDGAFIYLIQNFNKHHQMGVKYDWYDPNTEVKGEEIGKSGSNLNATDIKYSTVTVGYNYIINENVRLMLWYDFIKNESTALPDYADDIKDNIFTARLQFKF